MAGLSWQSAVIGNMVFVERAKRKKMRFIGMSWILNGPFGK
jgi:hypothetical protein